MNFFVLPAAATLAPVPAGLGTCAFGGKEGVLV